MMQFKSDILDILSVNIMSTPFIYPLPLPSPILQPVLSKMVYLVLLSACPNSPLMGDGGPGTATYCDRQLLDNITATHHLHPLAGGGSSKAIKEGGRYWRHVL